MQSPSELWTSESWVSCGSWWVSLQSLHRQGACSTTGEKPRRVVTLMIDPCLPLAMAVQESSWVSWAESSSWGVLSDQRLGVFRGSFIDHLVGQYHHHESDARSEWRMKLLCPASHTCQQASFALKRSIRGDFQRQETPLIRRGLGFCLEKRDMLIFLPKNCSTLDASLAALCHFVFS